MSLQLILQRIQFFIKEVNTLIFDRYHFLPDQVGKNMIKLEYCRSEDQIADIFTKPLKIDVFIKLRDMLDMKVVPNQIYGRMLVINSDFISLKLFTVIIALMISLQGC